MVASRLGHTEIMNELYMFKKNNALKMDLINSKSMHQTPLIIASHAKQLKTVEYLLSRDGILVNDRVHDGWNALMVASVAQEMAVCKILLNRGAVDTLPAACAAGRMKSVQHLLMTNVDVNQPESITPAYTFSAPTETVRGPS